MSVVFHFRPCLCQPWGTCEEYMKIGQREENKITIAHEFMLERLHRQGELIPLGTREELRMKLEAAL